MRARHILLGFTALLALAACSSSDADEDKKPDQDKQADAPAPPERKGRPICPQVAIVRELETLRDYGAEKPDPAQLVAAAQMKGIDGDCGYQEDGIDINFTVNMVAGRGPRLGGDRAGFPFFVAVVDPARNVLNKDRMTAEFSFTEGEKFAEHSEPLHVFIPLPEARNATGPDYQVLVGFQLTADQVAAARAREAKRLPVPANSSGN